jgi:hypothetical protein
MNASVRENILFGHRYEEDFYNSMAGAGSPHAVASWSGSVGCVCVFVVDAVDAVDVAWHQRPSRRVHWDQTWPCFLPET